MTVHNIDLNTFQKNGIIETAYSMESIKISTPVTVNTHFDRFTEPIAQYVFFPEKYKIPLKIDLTVQIDSPAFYVLLGKGHVSFNSCWSDNHRISDIAAPKLKPINFNNEMPVNTDVDISILYGATFMQIMINGEERYYTKKSAYMKKKLIADMNETGLQLGVACSKRTQLNVKKVSVTEYEADEAFSYPHGNYEIPLLGVDKTGKFVFETCISQLSKELQNKIIDVDKYLLSHKALGIKRKIEGSSNACRITYVSGIGFSYVLIINKNIMYHYFWWYMVSNYKYEGKYLGRKNDLTEHTLNEIQKYDPNLADRLFDLYISCVGCSPGCAGRTLYEYDGKKKMTCHGKILFKMIAADFDDVLRMMEAVERLI